ncbi:MAG: TetR/AcrR family transcriptional regulator [Labedaea sp.]
MEGNRPLRSDARQNRDRILAAATEVFAEFGPSAPLEEISRRAGTGIATLYRRFPDRQALWHAVVVDALTRTLAEARLAVAEEPDAFAALARYMHRALDIRVAAVIPALLRVVTLDDAETNAVREPGVTLLQRLIDTAKREGALRTDVTFADIGTLVVRLSRPLPGGFSREQNDALAHRHLDLLINGLRAVPDRAGALSGPALGLEELRRLRQRTGD